MTRFSEYDKKEVNLLARFAGRGEREGAPPGGAPERVMSVDDEKGCYGNLTAAPDVTAGGVTLPLMSPGGPPAPGPLPK